MVEWCLTSIEESIAKTLPGEALVIVSFVAALKLVDETNYTVDDIRLVVVVAISCVAVLTLLLKVIQSSTLQFNNIKGFLLKAEILYPICAMVQAIFYCLGLWGHFLFPDINVIGAVSLMVGFVFTVLGSVLVKKTNQ